MPGGHRPVSSLESDVILLKTGGSSSEEVILLNTGGSSSEAVILLKTGLPSDTESDLSLAESPPLTPSSVDVASDVGLRRSTGLAVMNDVMRVEPVTSSVLDAISESQFDSMVRGDKRRNRFLTNCDEAHDYYSNRSPIRRRRELASLL